MLFFSQDCDPTVESCPGTTDDYSSTDPTNYSTDTSYPTASTGMTGDQASWIMQMDVVVAKAKASATEAQQIADNANSWWAKLIGAESTLAALRTNAAASKTLANVLEAKAQRLAADPNLSAADFNNFMGAQLAIDNSASRAASSMLSASSAAGQVAADSAKDAVDAINKAIDAAKKAADTVGSGLKIAPYIIAGAAGLLFVALFLRVKG